MSTFRVQIMVGVDVEADNEIQAIAQAIEQVRYRIGDDPTTAHPKPFWVTGVAYDGDERMVYEQTDAKTYTRTLTGVWAEVLWNDDTDEQPEPKLFSFGEFDPDHNNDGYDTMGFKDTEVFFHTTHAEIARLSEPDNGEDFRIVDIIEWLYEEG